MCFSQADRLAGAWIGSVGRGERAASVVCFFENGAGKIFSIELATENQIGELTLTAGRLHFEVAFLKAAFEGTLSADGSRIVGEWIQPGAKEPMLLERTDKHSVSPAVMKGIDAYVPKSPTVVRAGGKDRLFYELHITNWSDAEMALEQVDVMIGDDVAVIKGEGLKKLAIAAGTKLAPGVRSVVLVPVAGSNFPGSIKHRVTFKLEGEVRERTIECAPAQVLTGAVRIAPPLGRGSWTARAGPDASLHHRGIVIPYQGRATISQRFAFDFLHETNGIGDAGAPVLAVADAVVHSVKDGLPENQINAVIPAVPLKVEDMFGNRITLDLGGDRYATYGHLRAGLSVKAGDRVRVGQVLGAIGNSGHTTGPHLHFQITDGPDPIGSEGLPFVFASFEHEGSMYSDEMPLSEWLITFPKPAGDPASARLAGRHKGRLRSKRP